MAHISYTRSVLHSGRRRLEQILPWDHQGASFAAFCGTPEQRRAVGLQGIHRCCGNRGVVVLQNDRPLARDVGQLRSRYPQLAQRYPWFRTYSVNPMGSANSFYDPLYGLPLAAVLDAIAPTDGSGYGAVSVLSLRTYLSAYLEIMQLKFQRNPAPFGRYPFNRDLLLQLTQMPLHQLECQVLSYLPEPARTHLSGLLSQENAQQQAYAAVNAFATELGDFLWTNKGFARHSCMSIVEAVRQRCVISVTIPSPRPAVLRCLYQELKTLKDARTEFLLVVSGVPLPESPELRQLFTGQHDTASYSTGLLASDLSQVIGDVSELAPLLAQHQEVLIFGCSSAQQAAPFSDALGTYQRTVWETHEEQHRQPFHFFSDHGHGVGSREVTEHNITPQEFLYLGDGAVLCGSLYLPPVIIRHVSL